MSEAPIHAGLVPVRVNEEIPLVGAHRLTREEAEAGQVPTPPHLLLYPELARGGMGRIYPAFDRNLLRQVALKCLDHELASDAWFRDGFIAEAQITGQLEHPNILPVYELRLNADGVPYFTMKLVRGRTFHDWMSEDRYAVGKSARIQEGLEVFLKVCDAVAYAHYRGVLHRDLKPENIMIGDFGQVYLMDWGLSRLTKSRPMSGENAQMEAHGPTGTPGFMSPEQVHGDPALMNERTDVYGMGAILYVLLSGRAPYDMTLSDEALNAATLTGATRPIHEACYGLGISEHLQAIVTTAIAKRPEDRFPDVPTLQAAVRAMLRGGFHLPRRVFAAGDVIIQEGDTGDCAYMLINGRCQVYRRHAGHGGAEPLGMLQPGTIFGEMALLLDAPRSASVSALDQVTVQVIERKVLTSGTDGWLGALVRTLASRFRTLEERVRKRESARTPQA